jgi:multidrug efflux pump subunit AcrB
MFLVNWNNGVNYNLVTQTPQYRIQSVQDIQNIPIAGRGQGNSEILGDLASMKRSHEMAIVSHYNIRRVVDIYVGVQDRDLGATSRDVERIVDRYRQHLPRGTFITIRGQVDTMHSSYTGLIAGLHVV